MSKEELKNKLISEAQACWNKLNIIKRVSGSEFSYYDGYIDCGFIKEKQIQIDAEQIRALQKDKGELTDRVKELEAQIEGMKRYLDCEYCEHYTQRSGCKNCNEEIRSDWKLKEIKENA